MNEKDIQQALCDLGYDSETIERARRLFAGAAARDKLLFLRQLRKNMLDAVHECEKKISCLDYQIKLPPLPPDGPRAAPGKRRKKRRFPRRRSLSAAELSANSGKIRFCAVKLRLTPPKQLHRALTKRKVCGKISYNNYRR